MALLLQACPLSWRRVSVNDIIHPDDVAFIVPGKTALGEIVERLGAPDHLEAIDTGALIRYQFLDAKYFQVNFTRPLPFLVPALSAVPSDLYELTVAGGGIGTDELQVGFDREWVVVYYAFAHHSKASHYLP
ncbi:hypothetical protein [Candidatus Nitrospira bockiana]